jgi:hypothetical protein
MIDVDHQGRHAASMVGPDVRPIRSASCVMEMIGRAMRREMTIASPSPISAVITPMPRMIFAEEIAAASASPQIWKLSKSATGV